MPEGLQPPRTMVACTAGFDRDHCRRELLKKCKHLLASQLLPQNRLLGSIHSVKLKNVFRRIHPNSANLLHGRSPLSEVSNSLILAHSMPSGTVHTRSGFYAAPACTRRRNSRARGGGIGQPGTDSAKPDSVIDGRERDRRLGGPAGSQRLSGAARSDVPWAIM